MPPTAPAAASSAPPASPLMATVPTVSSVSSPLTVSLPIVTTAQQQQPQTVSSMASPLVMPTPSPRLPSTPIQVNMWPMLAAYCHFEWSPYATLKFKHVNKLIALPK